MGKSDGTDTCASPKATGTHPAGVAERSTTGSGLDVIGTLVVVGTRVWELVNTARTAATMTITTAVSLCTVLMVPRTVCIGGTRTEVMSDAPLAFTSVRRSDRAHLGGRRPRHGRTASRSPDRHGERPT